MKDLFNPTCDRHGHILTGFGGSPQMMAPFIFPTAEEMAFLPVRAGDGSAPNLDSRLNDAHPKMGQNEFKIRKILVPVDSEHTKPTDLNRAIQHATDQNDSNRTVRALGFENLFVDTADSYCD